MCEGMCCFFFFKKNEVKVIFLILVNYDLFIIFSFVVVFFLNLYYKIVGCGYKIKCEIL